MMHNLSGPRLRLSSNQQRSLLSRMALSLVLTTCLGACSQQSTYHRPELDVAPAWQQEARDLGGQQTGLWWQGFQDRNRSPGGC